ncbi:hypothetical protein FKM82_015264 [Ascaphus truei]
MPALGHIKHLKHRNYCQARTIAPTSQVVWNTFTVFTSSVQLLLKCHFRHPPPSIHSHHHQDMALTL